MHAARDKDMDMDTVATIGACIIADIHRWTPSAERWTLVRALTQTHRRPVGKRGRLGREV
jgi:hypothetical protein